MPDATFLTAGEEERDEKRSWVRSSKRHRQRENDYHCVFRAKKAERGFGCVDEQFIYFKWKERWHRSDTAHATDLHHGRCKSSSREKYMTVMCIFKPSSLVRHISMPLSLFFIADNASLFVTDTHHPPGHSLFTQLSLPASIHLSDSNGLNAPNPLYPLIDADLAALFVSTVSVEEKSEPNHDPPFDEVFLSSVNDLVSSSEPMTAMGPPPGFENFQLDPALSNHTTNGSTIDDTAPRTMQSQVLSSDTINFSQLLPSTLVGKSRSISIAGRIIAISLQIY